MNQFWPHLVYSIAEALLLDVCSLASCILDLACVQTLLISWREVMSLETGPTFSDSSATNQVQLCPNSIGPKKSWFAHSRPITLHKNQNIHRISLRWFWLEFEFDYQSHSGPNSSGVRSSNSLNDVETGTEVISLPVTRENGWNSGPKMLTVQKKLGRT